MKTNLLTIKEYVQFFNRLCDRTWFGAVYICLKNHEAVNEKRKPFQTRLYKLV